MRTILEEVLMEEYPGKEAHGCNCGCSKCNEDSELEALFEDAETQEKISAVPTQISTVPTPGAYYQIKRGDNLLSVAGKAYNIKAGAERLKLAQLVNNYPLNLRYRQNSMHGFEKRNFPKGIISFLPKITCDINALNHPFQFPKTGNCYPVIFIPHKSDIWLNPPFETVQSNSNICWASSILSFSKSFKKTRQFNSIEQIKSTFKKIVLNVPGNTKQKIVNINDGLIPIPKSYVEFIHPNGSKIPVTIGQITIEKIAMELGLDWVKKGSNFNISDLHLILEQSQSPLLAFRGASGKTGHVTVVFGVSKNQNFLGDMDPFSSTNRYTGPSLSKLNSNWTPMFNSFLVDSTDNRHWENFYFLFKKK